MKTFSNMLAFVCVVCFIAMVVFGGLSIGAMIEHDNPGAVDDLDKLTIGFLVLTLATAIPVVFYQEGEKDGSKQKDEDSSDALKVAKDNGERFMSECEKESEK